MKRSHSEISGSGDVKQANLQANSPTRKTHQPKISRKIRACQECQSRKIRCGIEPGASACGRCQRLGLTCIVNKSLQTLLEDECEWKVEMENKMQSLQSTVSEIIRHLNLSALEHSSPSPPHSAGSSVGMHHGTLDGSTQGGSTAPNSATFQAAHSRQPSTLRPSSAVGMSRENSAEPEQQEAEGDELVEAPMTSLFEVTKLRNLRNWSASQRDPKSRTYIHDDFISQGKVSLQDAEDLFQRFNTTLNQYLWGGIALVHKDLTSVRESSSILLAAILAVTALHVPSMERVYDGVYPIFLSLVREAMFGRGHSLDDVRALCIGAFWLSEVSWKLSGLAFRIGTELNLHHSFSKALHGQTEHVERARVWYLLYVCDHHFSIAYNRPPVMQEDMSITRLDSFLQLPGITQADWRILSQVAAFKILSRIYQQFGPDPSRPLSEADLESLTSYNVDLDNWRTTWEPHLCPNKYVSKYPTRCVIMHWNFGKLQLNSLALRGLTPHSQSGKNTIPYLSPRRLEFANLAIGNALGTLNFFLDDPNVRTSMVGVPLYLHAMITAAACFLLKVELRWKKYAGLSMLPLSALLDTLERVTSILATAEASDRHMSFHIARGLNSMIAKFRKLGCTENNLVPTTSATSRSNLESGIGSSSCTPMQTSDGTPSLYSVTSSAVTPALAPADLVSMTGMGIGSASEDWAAWDHGSDPGLFSEVMEVYGFDQDLFKPGVLDMLSTQMM